MNLYMLKKVMLIHIEILKKTLYGLLELNKNIN